jgi:aromatic-L-amino-acid decarboxylase
LVGSAIFAKTIRLSMTELDLLADADARARRFVSSNETRRVFPDSASLAALAAFDEDLTTDGRPEAETLAMLDEFGSPAAVAGNGPRYFGFVVGASLPIAAAAERMVLAWDQSASTPVGAPGAAAIEKVAGRWLLEILGLPDRSAVGFGTSASACGLTCVTAARRKLLATMGWDFDRKGLAGAPAIRVVVSDVAHVTMIKALRVLGFGTDNLVVAETDTNGRINAAKLPPLDAQTILCLQAGEVNTGSFDPFADIIPGAKAAGAWVHVDGAFGLWARASDRLRWLTEGVDQADSWTIDGHKWLNTPYDCAMSIVRDADALAGAMTSDAAYSSAGQDAQKNLTLEFSRRARGVAVWAALRSLGRAGVAALVEGNVAHAQRIGAALRDAGYDVLNEVVLNQVLFRASSDVDTVAIRDAAAASGELWFGGTVWRGRPASRISVSSWRTRDEHVDLVIAKLQELKTKSLKADWETSCRSD